MSRPGHTIAAGVEGPGLAHRDEPAADAEIARKWEDEPPSGIVFRSEALTLVPRLAVSMGELMALPLDHRAGFMASFVDGTFTIEMILDACALPREVALGILGELTARGVIVL